MMMRALTLAVVLTGVGAVLPQEAASQETVWTLDRCEESALAVSPVLAGGRARAQASRAGAEAADSARLPVVGVSGKTGYTTETMKLSIPSPLGTQSIEFGDGTNSDLMVGLRAPLFRGGALQANRRAAEEVWRAGLAEVAADSLDLRRQVRQAFFAALGGQAAVDAARQGENRLRRHLAEVEGNLAVGMATEEARLQVLARLLRTEQTTLQAEAQAAAWRYQLGRLVGRSGEAISPAAELENSLLSGAEESRPWDSRPQVQAVTARQAAADHSARAASGSFWPALDLEGGWHYGKPGIDSVADKWMDYGTVAVNLRWTVFDFGGRDHQVGRLRAEGRALAAAREDVLDALRTRQANALTQVETAARENSRASERLDLEKRRLELASERWREGHATESELLDAQDDVTLAASDLAMATARLRWAEAEHLAALGW